MLNPENWTLFETTGSDTMAGKKKGLEEGGSFTTGPESEPANWIRFKALQNYFKPEDLNRYAQVADRLRKDDPAMFDPYTRTSLMSGLRKIFKEETFIQNVTMSYNNSRGKSYIIFHLYYLCTSPNNFNLHHASAGKNSPSSDEPTRGYAQSKATEGSVAIVDCDDEIQLHTVDATKPVPAVAKPFLKAIPALQHTFVNANYEEFMSVYVQCYSGVDPANPPDFNARLDPTGKNLLLSMPFTHLFQDDKLLTHKNHAWMHQEPYDIERNSKCAGLGPAIAEAHTYFGTKKISAEISIPLEKSCSTIIGDHHISSFPSDKNAYGARFPVVMVHFLLKCENQKVKRKAAPVHSVWQNDDERGEPKDDRNYGTPAGPSGSANKRSFSHHE